MDPLAYRQSKHNEPPSPILAPTVRETQEVIVELEGRGEDALAAANDVPLRAVLCLAVQRNLALQGTFVLAIAS